MSGLSIKKIDPKALPTMEEVSKKIEKILRALFRDSYSKYVIKQDNTKFLILPPRYYYFPPIVILINSHPDDESRALFISLTRRIPLDSNDDLFEILGSVDELLGGYLEIVHRSEEAKLRGDEEANKMYYLVLTHKLHALAMEDEAWFLLILTALIRADEKLFSKVQAPERVESSETTPVEFT